MSKYDRAIIGNGMSVRTRRPEYKGLSLVAHDAIKAGAKTATNAERVARIEAAYLKTKLTLERAAHTCVSDELGICTHCGLAVETPWWSK